MGQESDNTPETDLAEPIDVSAAIAAQVFGDVPIVGPDWLRSSITMQANFAQLLPGATSANATDLNGPRNRAEREDDEAKAKADRMANVVEEVARQREGWARTSHNFGTTVMTGQQWETMSADLEEGGALRNWLLARIMADGHTREEAERLTDRVAGVAEIMAVPESQRTLEQRRELAEAERDPEVRQYVDAASRQSQEMHGPATRQSEVAASTDAGSSIERRAGTINDFPSAPNLGEAFLTAQAASATLEGPRTGPSQPAAEAPQRVLASGLDI